MSRSALSLALSVFDVLPGVIKAGAEVMQLIEGTIASLKIMQSQSRDPSPAEWEAIHKQIDALRGELTPEVVPAKVVADVNEPVVHNVNKLDTMSVVNENTPVITVKDKLDTPTVTRDKPSRITPLK